jgi:hypothetical protein
MGNYNTKISAFENWLFGEIRAFIAGGEKDYCWASNRHFADKYQKSISAISRAVSHLRKAGLLRVVVNFTNNTRQIYLTDAAASAPKPACKNAHTPAQICTDNIKQISKQKPKHRGGLPPQTINQDKYKIQNNKDTKGPQSGRFQLSNGAFTNNVFAYLTDKYAQEEAAGGPRVRK